MNKKSRPRDEKGKFIIAKSIAKTKVAKPKVTVAEIPVKVPIEIFPKCKSCDKDTIKILYDSRAKEPLYIYLCDNSECNLYRRPQKCEGVKPKNANFIMS